MSLRKILLLLLLFPFTTAMAQKFEKKLILVLPDTSAERLAEIDLSFGPGDDYCYYYQDAYATLTTRSKRYEPLINMRKYYKPGIFYDTNDETTYIKSTNNAVVFGPYKGRIDINDHSVTYPNGGMSYVLSSGDSISYYIDGNCVAKMDSSGYINRSNYVDNWCAFSSSGNLLYTLKKDKWNYLYLNGKKVDSSLYYFGRLSIDDRNNYNYMLGTFEQERKFYRFMPVSHKPGKVFYPIWSLHKTGMKSGVYDNVFSYKDDDTLYYYGNGEGKNHFSPPPFDRPLHSSTALVLTKGNTIFGYEPAEWAYNRRVPASMPQRICINEKGYDLPYEEIILPCIDAQGNYTLLGRRDYYLYKNINGTEIKEPLSKHGVRAKPISMDIHGNTICYYETDDSVFVYQNDKLFKNCVAHRFELQLCNGIWSNDFGQGCLYIFCMDSASYIIYNNTISPPVLKIEERSDNNIIRANVSEHGYWLLQNAGNGKYDLIINHQLIKLPIGIKFDGLMGYKLAKYFRLTANEFIFYTKENFNIYQYKLRV